jgi:hypothetical protein
MSDTLFVKTRLISQLIASVHNERLTETYGTENLSGKGKDSIKQQAILDNFKIEPTTDPFPLVVLKILGYYLVFDRQSHPSVPYLYPIRTEGIKPQLCLHFRPTKRKKWKDKKGKVRYSKDGYFHIPHWKESVLTHPPAIPSFTIGSYSTKYTLIDNSYILIHTKTEKQGKEVMLQLAELTDPKFRPSGTIEDNLIQTKRGGGKVLESDGLIMQCFQISYFRGGESDPFYSVQV